jgi:hypothetical protein
MPVQGGPPGDDSPYDVCHSESHPFVAASVAYLESHSEGLVVQIHGYSDGASSAKVPARERPPAPATAVVSSGSQTSTNGFRQRNAWRDALSLANGSKAWVYPEETHALGATTNVLGQRLRGSKYEFVHIEMAAALRHELGTNAKKRRSWAKTMVTELCRNGGLRCRD